MHILEKYTFLAESSKEFFTADPSHLSIFTGLSSIFHCKTNGKTVHQKLWHLTKYNELLSSERLSSDGMETRHHNQVLIWMVQVSMQKTQILQPRTRTSGCAMSTHTSYPILHSQMSAEKKLHLFTLTSRKHKIQQVQV